MAQEMTGLASAFSEDYASARDRFLSAARDRGFRLESFPIGRTGPSGESLTIDAALIGAARPERLMIVSSGLHGIEGFFGSAVQLAFLESQPRGWAPGSNEALLFLHALNPFGFAWKRRFDEENVDLNRNFLLEGQTYSGSPARYAALDRWLNPDRPPSRFDLFRVRALGMILRYGTADLKAAIAGGQFDYPRGIFFGGSEPSRVHQILEVNMHRWLEGVRAALHLDFHTGLGDWATYRLLLEPGLSPARIERARQAFGSEFVDISEINGISYPTCGDLGAWCRTSFGQDRYDYLCAEFGTYPALRVLSALRAENQAHHKLSPGNAAYDRAKHRLKEMFAPADPAWREATVAQALELIERAGRALFCPDRPAPSVVSD